jgi:hypothetical protein
MAGPAPSTQRSASTPSRGFRHEGCGLSRVIEITEQERDPIGLRIVLVQPVHQPVLPQDVVGELEQGAEILVVANRIAPLQPAPELLRR